MGEIAQRRLNFGGVRSGSVAEKVDCGFAGRESDFKVSLAAVPFQLKATIAERNHLRGRGIVSHHGAEKGKSIVYAIRTNRVGTVRIPIWD